MKEYVVTVIFNIDPESWEEFLTLLKKNAEETLKEPGCIQFDISNDMEYNVFLYEIYQSKEVFDQHVKTVHYDEFSKKASHMIKNKTVNKFTLNFYSK